MRRLLISLVAVAALGGAAPALADEGDDNPFDDQGAVVVSGEIVSVDTTAGTITANATVRGDDENEDEDRDDADEDRCDDNPPPAGPTGAMGPTGPMDDGDDDHGDDDGDQSGPDSSLHSDCSHHGDRSRFAEREQVTLTTDGNTTIKRNGAAATLSDLQPGDEFVAVIIVPAGAPQGTELSFPVSFLAAHTPTAFFGFAGTVTAVDGQAGTLSVNVSRVTGAARALLGDTALPTVLQFGVDDDTRVILRGRTALTGVHVGDLVGVGVGAGRGATLQEVLATPADVIVKLTGQERRARGARRARFLRRAAHRAARFAHARAARR